PFKLVRARFRRCAPLGNTPRRGFVKRADDIMAAGGREIAFFPPEAERDGAPSYVAGMAARSEKIKMIGGEPYDPRDPELVTDRVRARELLQRLNICPPGDDGTRRALTRSLLGLDQSGRETDAFLQAPFFCDYGY